MYGSSVGILAESCTPCPCSLQYVAVAPCLVDPHPHPHPHPYTSYSEQRVQFYTNLLPAACLSVAPSAAWYSCIERPSAHVYLAHMISVLSLIAFLTENDAC